MNTDTKKEKPYMPVFTIEVKPPRGLKKEKEILKQITQLEKARIEIRIILAMNEADCSKVMSRLEEAQIREDQDLIETLLYEIQCFETQCEIYKKTLVLLNEKLVDKKTELSIVRVERICRRILNDDTHIKTSPRMPMSPPINN